MKQLNAAFVLALILFLTNNLFAQTDPGTANLTHQWTFDDGTAKDAITTNPANGVLLGGATIVNKALKLSAQGQYLAFSGPTLALNTYSVISQEIWYTSVAGANTGYTMLSYFGTTSGGQGYNYISTSTARGDNKSRTAITDGTYSNEVSANGPEYDDGLLHQMVSIIRADSVLLYIDGSFVAKTANTKSLTTINTSMAYLGKGGYTSDPTWIGTISKYSIYNKSLTPGEVKYLYQQGPEQSPIISTNASSLSFDELFKTDIIKVSGLNLTDSITITAPAGISLSVSKLQPNVIDANVQLIYDGTSSIIGNVTLTSGSVTINIPVKSYNNTCYTKLYPDITNLIPNPYISSLSDFAGWGTRSINTNHTYVYCGATSGKVTGTNGGSLDVTLTGKLLTNTTYRVKAKVLAIGGTFQIGIFGWANGKGDYTKSISGTGTWQDVDFTLTTGSALGTTQGIFFNNYGLSGTTGYIDNWEMYAIPKVYPSATSVHFPTPGSKQITIRGVSLNQVISITAPPAFSLSTDTMPAGANGNILTITFNHSTSADGYIYFTSGNVKDSIYVSGSVDPTIVTSVPLVLVDEINNTASFSVTGYNLTTDVTLSAPSGITLTPSVLPPTVNGTNVTVTYSGTGNSSGSIALTSGSATVNVNLTAAPNSECFTPLYQGSTNLIVDPTCNTNTTGGWGNKSINADPAYVYCGSRSGKVSGDGSLERNLTGLLKPNTAYRVRAKVYKLSSVKDGNMGHVTFTLGIDSASLPEPYRLIKAAMDSACYYYSKYTPFIENIYVYYSSGIPTAQASYRGSIGFGSNTSYMWVGTAMHEMAHYFGSGTTTTWKNLMSTGTWTGTSGSNLIKTITGGVINGDPVHYWPTGINYKTEITNLGGQDAQREGLINHTKIVKAMLVDDCAIPTNNPKVGVGIYGWDASSGDIYHEVNISNSWQEIDFTFTTGASLKATQSIYFNRGSGYIDNWELYEVPIINKTIEINQPECKIYSNDDKIITELNLAKYTNVNILIFDIHGKPVYSQKNKYKAGYFKEECKVSLSNGMYMVQLVGDDFIISKKILLLNNKK